MSIIDGGSGCGDANYEQLQEFLDENTVVKWKTGNTLE